LSESKWDTMRQKAIAELEYYVSYIFDLKDFDAVREALHLEQTTTTYPIVDGVGIFYTKTLPDNAYYFTKDNVFNLPKEIWMSGGKVGNLPILVQRRAPFFSIVAPCRNTKPP
jgi:hypothetical protein